MIKVYIASPYTIGDQAINVRRQMQMFNVLANAGFLPFAPIPNSHFQQMMYPRDSEDWMRLDFAWVETCDCLLRLSGESKGADREMECARKAGKPVFTELEELLTYYRGTTNG